VAEPLSETVDASVSATVLATVNSDFDATQGHLNSVAEGAGGKTAINWVPNPM
jgi:hypothetical protein